MSGIYTQEFKIRSTEVNKHRFLRTSALFTMLQEISIAHTTALGMGRDKTLDRGLLWILAQQRAEINRMPEYDEDVVLKSWPGDMMRMLFPRYYQMETADGEILIKGSAIWSLLGEESRTLIDSDEYGVHIDGYTTGDEIDLIAGPRPSELTNHSEFSVPFSYIDINGHLNNAKYFDIVDDLIPAAHEGLMPSLIAVRYITEARENSILNLDWGFTPADETEDTDCAGSYYTVCTSGEQTTFKMQTVYRNR